jgi:hypothetical protein
LPSAPQPREREGEAGGMTRRALTSSKACAHDHGAMRTLGRARRCHGLASTRRPPP